MALQPALTPNENVDFICGRGGDPDNKPGNQEELEDVERFLPEYLQSPRRQKRPVVEKVIDAVKDRGGRFLKKVKDREGITVYMDITDSEECLVKVGQQFRDMDRKRREQELQWGNGAANVVVQPNPDEQSNMAMVPGPGAEPVEPHQQPLPLGNEGAPEENHEMDAESLEVDVSPIDVFAVDDFVSDANRLFERYMLANQEGSPVHNMAKATQECLMQLEAAATEADVLALLKDLGDLDSALITKHDSLLSDPSSIEDHAEKSKHNESKGDESEPHGAAFMELLNTEFQQR